MATKEVATEEIDLYKCPKCQSGTADLECYECEGLGVVVDDDDNEDDCGNCNGDGTIYGEFECIECGHVYSETDLY